MGLAGCDERVGLTTVGRLLVHRQRDTTAIYAHLDDSALRDTRAQAEAASARAMLYRAEPPLVPDEADDAGDSREPDRSNGAGRRIMLRDLLESARTASRDGRGRVETCCRRTCPTPRN